MARRQEENNAINLIKALSDFRVENKLANIIRDALNTKTLSTQTTKQLNKNKISDIDNNLKETTKVKTSKKITFNSSRNLIDTKKRTKTQKTTKTGWSLFGNSKKKTEDDKETQQTKQLINKDLEKKRKKSNVNTYILARELTLNGDPNLITNTKLSLFDGFGFNNQKKQEKENKKLQQNISRSLEILTKTTKKISKTLSWMSLLQTVQMLGTVLKILKASNWISDTINKFKKSGWKKIQDQIFKWVGNLLTSFGTRWIDGMIEKWVKHPIGQGVAKIVEWIKKLPMFNTTTERETTNGNYVPSDQVANSNNADENIQSGNSLVNTQEDLRTSDINTSKIEKREDKEELFGYGELSDLLKGVNTTNLKSYSKSKGGTKFSLPVNTIVTKVKQTNTNGLCISIQKADSDPDMKSKPIVVTNILKLMVPKGTIIWANVTICILSNKGKIIGDLNDFLNGGNFEQNINDMNKHAKLSETLDKSFMEQDGMEDAYQKSYDSLTKKEEGAEEKRFDFEVNNSGNTDLAGSTSVNVQQGLDNANQLSKSVNKTNNIQQSNTNNTTTTSQQQNKSQNVTYFSNPNPDASARSSSRTELI